MLYESQPVYEQCGDRHLWLEIYGLFGQQATMQGLHCLASHTEKPRVQPVAMLQHQVC